MILQLMRALQAGERIGEDLAVVAGEPDDIRLEARRLLQQQLIAPTQVRLQARRDAPLQGDCDAPGRPAIAINRRAQAADVPPSIAGQVAPEHVQLVTGRLKRALPIMLAHAAREEGFFARRRACLVLYKFVGMVELGDEEDSAWHRGRANRLLSSSFATRLRGRRWRFFGLSPTPVCHQIGLEEHEIISRDCLVCISLVSKYIL